MNYGRTWAILRFILTTLFLFFVWILFTATSEPFTLIFGLFASLVTASLTYHIFLPKHQASLKFILPNPFYLIIFLVLMVANLYKSSFQVAKAVFTGNTNPRIVHFRTRLRSDIARTILANSITFTPGTLTLDLNDDHIVVHWLLCSTIHNKAAGEEIKSNIEKTLGRTWK